MSRRKQNEAELADRRSIEEFELAQGSLVGGFAVSLHSDLVSCELPWRQIEQSVGGTLYQSHSWCQSWVATVGASSGIKPMVVVGYAAQNQTAFVLPFQLRRRFGITVLEWLTQPDNNYAMGLLDMRQVNVDWVEQNFATLLQRLPKFDVVNLQSMPFTVGGEINPLASISRSRAANNSYAMVLQPDYDELHANKRSVKSISKIRRRDDRLSKLGAVTFEQEQISQAAQDRLNEVIHDKNVHLAQRGIGAIFNAHKCAFLRGMIEDDFRLDRGLQVYRLALDGKTLSSVVGSIHNSCYYLMIAALAPDGPRHLSPGDLLLRLTIKHCCALGVKRFDFGRGVEDYKLSWADETIALYNTFAAVTFKGLPYAGGLLAFNAVKRTIKKSDRFRKLFFELRRILRGRDL